MENTSLLELFEYIPLCWIPVKDIFISGGTARFLVYGMRLKVCKNGNMVRLILVNPSATEDF
jgi:hypothetical protein